MYSIGAASSDVGRRREYNEDAFFLDDETQLYIVADGMGGHAAGDVAANLAIDRMQSGLASRSGEVAKLYDDPLGAGGVAAIARTVVQEAGAAVYETAQAMLSHKGMGCTLTALLVLGRHAVLAHVGDTRLYLMRGGSVNQLTTDHTVAQTLALAGMIQPEEVATHQYTHVLTRALGPKPTVTVDTLVFDILPGDRLLICSDGLSDYLGDEGWLAKRLEVGELQSITDGLTEFACEAGGKDNVTALVVEIQADEPEVAIVDEMSVDIGHRYAALESVFLFEGLPRLLLTQVLGRCALRTFAGGDTVIAEGAHLAQLMVVVDGRFMVSHGGVRDGELAPGEHAGATTLLSPRGCRATLSALEPSRLLILDREPFWELVRASPWLGIGLLERLGRRLSLDLDQSIMQREGAPHRASKLAPGERF